MKYLRKFNELKSSTYISAADKLSEIDYSEYEDTIYNLERHAELMKVINNETGNTPDNVINIFRDILKSESMWDNLYKKSNIVYDKYIKDNIRKVDRAQRKKVRERAFKLSTQMRKPYFDLKEKIIKDTMEVYDIKVGDVFRLGDEGEFVFVRFTDIQYFFENPSTYAYQRIDVLDLPIEIENNKVEKVDTKAIFNKDTNKWEIYKEEKDIEPTTNILDKIEKWFEDSRNGRQFTLTDSSNNFIAYSTREHGNIGDETPGQEDINTAIEIKNQLLSLYKDDIRVEIEVVDEWVLINIDVI